MAGNSITYSKKISGMASGLTIFVCCLLIFIRTKGDMTFDTMLYTLSIIIPAALVVGTLGYFIGKIFDGTKKKKKLNKLIK